MVTVSSNLSQILVVKKSEFHLQIGPRIPGFNAPPAATTPGPRTPNPKTPQQQQQKTGTSSSGAARVARNLFGKKSNSKGADPPK